MSDHGDVKRAADDLCAVTLAIEDVDLNALLDDDVRELLACKQALSEMCLRYRRDQRATAEADGGEDP